MNDLPIFPGDSLEGYNQIQQQQQELKSTDWPSIMANASNQFAFGIPEAVVRAVGGNKAAENIYGKQGEPSKQIGEIAGTVASAANPIGDIYGLAGRGVQKAGEFIRPAVESAGTAITNMLKPETSKITEIGKSAIQNGVNATIQQASREAATGQADWPSIVATGGIGAVLGGVMRGLTPKSTPVNPITLQNAEEQRVGAMGPVSPVREAVYSPSKGGAKAAQSVDVSEHISNQAKFLEDNKIMPGPQGKQKIQSLLNEYEAKMDGALDKIEDINGFKAQSLPINAVGAMRNSLSAGLSPEQIRSVQNGVDNAYKNIIAAKTPSEMKNVIDNIMNNTREATAGGTDFTAKGAFNLAVLARNNFFHTLNEISPDIADVYKNWGMAKEIDNQFSKGILQRVGQANAGPGSKTGMVGALMQLPNIGKFAKGALGSTVAPDIENALAQQMKNVKSNRLGELLKQQERSQNPAEVAKEKFLTSRVAPAAAGVISNIAGMGENQEHKDNQPSSIAAAHTNIKLPIGAQEQEEESKEKTIDGYDGYDNLTQERMDNRVLEAAKTAWTQSGNEAMSGGKPDPNDPIFRQNLIGIMNGLIDPIKSKEEGRIIYDPMKVAMYTAGNSDIDINNMESASTAWQSIFPNIKMAMGATIQNPFQKLPVGSNISQLASQKISEFGGESGTLAGRSMDAIMNGMSKFAEGTNTPPEQVRDRTQAILTQSSNPIEASKNLLDYMKTISQTKYRSLQLAGLVE